MARVTVEVRTRRTLERIEPPWAKEVQGLTPPQQLCFHLGPMKRSQVPFDRAWRIAFERIRWPHATNHRREWKTVLISQKTAWEECYEGRGRRHLAEAFENLLLALEPNTDPGGDRLDLVA